MGKWCWHTWGFWSFLTEDKEFQLKRCLRCKKGRARRTPKHIIEMGW